jgi:transposase
MQWEPMRLLPVNTRNRKHDKRELANAALFVAKTGCQWRNLPEAFPEWNAVDRFYSRARQNGVWDGILRALAEGRGNGGHDYPA